MDINYRSQVVGSPFVDEGFANRFLAKTSNALQGVSAMSGKSISPESLTKIKSLWGSFSNRIIKLLKDWETTSEMLKYRNASKLTPKQKRIISNWDTLYQQFVNGTLLSNVINPPKRPLQGFSQTSVKKNVPSSNVSVGNPNSMVAEGFFSRPLSISNALRTNNTDTILNAYQTELKNAYDDFIRDSIKLTKLSEDQIIKSLTSLKGDISSKVKLVRTKLGLNPKKKSPSSNPGANANNSTNSQGSNAPQNTSTSSASVSPSTPSATTNQSIPNSQSNTGQSSNQPPVIDPKIKESNELGSILLKVVDIIIDTISSDKQHSDSFVGKNPDGSFKKPLPSTWNEPPMTKDVKEEKNPNQNETPDEDEDDFDEHPGEFLYNFAGYYRKKRHFNIFLKSPNISNEILIGDGPKKIEVVWENNNHKNTIWIKYFDSNSDNKNSKNVKLFTFFDDEVSPRTEVGKQFSIEKIFKEANPSSDLFNFLDPKISSELKSKEPILFRSLYATTFRKSMEFKSKKKKSDQSVTTNTPKGGKVYDDFGWDQNGILKVGLGNKAMNLDPEKSVVELPVKDIEALHKAGYESQFPNKFNKLKIKSDKPASPKANTNEPSPESGEGNKNAPETKTGEKKPRLKKVSLRKAKQLYPNADIQVGSKIWIGQGKPTPIEKSPESWAKVVDDSKKS